MFICFYVYIQNFIFTEIRIKMSYLNSNINFKQTNKTGQIKTVSDKNNSKNNPSTTTVNKSSKKGILLATSLACLGVIGAAAVIYKKKTSAAEEVNELNQIIKNKTGEKIINKTKEEVKKAGVTIIDKLEEVKNYKKIDNVSEDLEQWNKKLESSPKVKTFHEGKEVIINVEPQKLIPHNYQEIPECYVCTKHGQPKDFETFKLDFESLNRNKEFSVPAIHEKIGSGKRNCIAGKTSDGKAYTVFCIPNSRRDYVNRPIFETILLVSKDGNFTQVQKDAIKIMKNVDDSAIEHGTQNPISQYFMYDGKSEGIKGIDMNYNTLLSGIHTWAEKIETPNNFDDYLNQLNDVTVEKPLEIIRDRYAL